MRRYWFLFIWWLWDHEPVFCGACSRVVLKKHAHVELTLTGQRVYVCEKCHDNYFGK